MANKTENLFVEGESRVNFLVCESIKATADKIGCVIAARKDAESDQLTLLAGKISKTI